MLKKCKGVFKCDWLYKCQLKISISYLEKRDLYITSFFYNFIELEVKKTSYEQIKINWLKLVVNII